MAKKKGYKPNNPFIYEGYVSPEYFCDRTEETENVISNLRNGRNVTIVSPRKIGKTGLIKHTFHQIKEQNKDAICIYTDIFHTQNQYELVQTLGRAIVQERLLDSRNAMSKVLGFFSAWRPTSRSDQYEMLMTFLSDNQRLLVKAIAKENLVAQPQANDFIHKYELPGASSIKKSLDVLTEKDLIYHTPQGFIIYDRFFDLWLKRLF